MGRCIFGLAEALIALLVLCWPIQAVSLEFTLHQNHSKNLNAVLATGEVKDGDTDRLIRFLANLPKKQNTAIYIASPGGGALRGHEARYVFLKESN